MDMSEVDADQPSPAERPGWGRRLREAREARGLSVERVASELRLGVKLLRAIENEDTSALPTPPFVKGYLRGYARILELDADLIVEAYGSGCESEEAPLIARIPRIKETTSNDSWPRYATWGVIAAITVSFAIWWTARILTGSDPSSSPPPSVEERTTLPRPEVVMTPAAPTAQAPVVEEASPVPEQLATESPETVIEGATTSLEAGEAASAEAAGAMAQVDEEDETPAPALPEAAQAQAIVLDVAEDSWVEITDAEGRKLFFNLARAGTRHSMQGVPPYKFILGNAKGVTLLYNGEPFDTTPYERKGVARFSLGE